MSAESRAAAARKRRRNELLKKKRWARSQRFAEKAVFRGIRWDSRSHTQLYEMIMSAKPLQMKRMADKWADLSEDIKHTTDSVHQTMNRVLGSWTGPSANTAAASTAALAQWATQAGDIATRIGVGLNQYTEAVMHAQRRMPPPPSGGGFLSGFHTGGVTVPNAAMVIGELVVDQKAQDEEARAAKAQAVRVMEDYGDESQQVHNTMPWFYDAPPPQQITPADVEESPEPEPKPEPVLGQEGSGVAGDIDGDGISDTTAPEGFTPTPSTPGPSSGGYATGFGAPIGAGGGDVSRGGGPGGLGPGAGGLSGVGAPAAAARAGMPAPGMPGAGPGGNNSFFPPMGAGAGAGREEDKDHKNKYDDGLDLLDDLPPHFPPVFGV